MKVLELAYGVESQDEGGEKGMLCNLYNFHFDMH